MPETEQWIAVRLQPRGRRRARAVLFAVSRVGLWWVLAVVLLSVDPPVTPPILFRLTLVLIVLPGLAARVLRGRPATATVAGEVLVVDGPGARLTVPCEAIGAVRVAPPFPDLGLDLVLRSGQRVVPGIDVDDPEPLLAALATAGAPAESARRHAAVVFVRARRTVVRQAWERPLVKFGLLALLPAGILFNAHQHIAYGGFWGEYYLLGARAWLSTLGTYWTVTAIYCVLYASVWRGVAEGVAFVVATVAPAHAARGRRLLEATCRLAYLGGIPLVVGLRFLP